MTDEQDQEKENEQQNVRSSSNYKKNLMGIIHSVDPLLKFAYFHGIFVIYLDKEELKPPNWKMKTFGLVSIAAYVVLFLCFFTLPTAFTGTMNLISTIEEIPKIVVLMQYVTSAAMSYFLAEKTRINLFTTFAKLDTMLRVESVLDFYQKTYSQTVKVLIILIITHTINGIADFVAADKISITSLLALPLFFYQKLNILSFCIMIFMVKKRLEFINSYLTTFTEERKEITVFTVNDTKNETKRKLNFIGRAFVHNKKIRDLATMYDLIGKITYMINEVFNYQIFMTLMSTFTFIVITIWTALSYYRTPENNPGSLINIGIWCFSAIYTVASMSFSCERLLLVRNESKILVNRIIMNYDLPKTMRVQAKAFMELIEAWPLRIYIYDMFSVDITLMLKFISVATTYLIVIIQISHFI